MANKQLPNKNLQPRIMTYWQIVLGLTVITILCGCAMEQGTVNQDRWISLFNGKNLEGWIIKITGHELNDNYGNTFCVEDGILKVSYDQYEKFDGKFGHLFYKGKFSHYILRVQYQRKPDLPLFENRPCRRYQQRQNSQYPRPVHYCRAVDERAVGSTQIGILACGQESFEAAQMEMSALRLK